MAAPSDFLQALFGRTLPDGLRAAIWTKPDKTSHYLDDPAGADRFAGQPDAYVAACLTTTTPANRRLKSRDARAIPGVWLDVDLPGPEDPPTKKPARDIEQAMAIANAVIEPTILVNSGYGLQAWWLLDDDPWVFGSEAEHQRAGRITQGWVLLHRQHARRHHVTLDGVHDLARVMRLPGTVNAKGDGRPVEVLQWDGPRHSIDAIAQLALSVPLPQDTASSITVDITTSFPLHKFEALKSNVPSFAITWEHQRRDREAQGWSTSEYDMALASLAARAGWSNDEIAALIVQHRIKYEGESSEKARREKYIADTVAKARNGIQREERAEIREQALERLAEIGDSPNGHVNNDVIMSHFNTLIGAGMPGAPVFKELVQYGRDPDQARYVLITDSGFEVNVGAYPNLRQPRRLDERIGPATGWVMETVKDGEEWRSALRALKRTADIREEPEEPVLEWTRLYLENHLGADRNNACQAREPFEEDGMVYLRHDRLAIFARGILKQPIRSEADLKPLMRRVGFEQHPVHYTNAEGRRTTASYWRISKGEVE